MIMEPLVYLLVTATTLTSHLAYLHQAMAMLHVVYASISILLDIGDIGGAMLTLYETQQKPRRGFLFFCVDSHQNIKRK